MNTPAQNPSNELSPFEFQSHQPYSLRAIVDEYGEPWFIAKDVATILDYSDAHKMCLHLDDAKKQVCQIGGFGPRGVITINEPGLFMAIINSQKPEAEAEAFRQWVISEVLPSIRLPQPPVNKSGATDPIQVKPVVILHDGKAITTSQAVAASDSLQVPLSLAGSATTDQQGYYRETGDCVDNGEQGEILNYTQGFTSCRLSRMALAYPMTTSFSMMGSQPSDIYTGISLPAGGGNPRLHMAVSRTFLTAAPTTSWRTSIYGSVVGSTSATPFVAQIAIPITYNQSGVKYLSSFDLGNSWTLASDIGVNAYDGTALTDTTTKLSPLALA